jgi:acetyl esterase/lipase
MSLFSFLGYFRLKVIITFLRMLTLYSVRKPLRRDAKLAEANYSVRRERLRIPSRGTGRFIIADLYSPSTSAASSSSAGQVPLPVLVNWHGSGFCLTGLLGSNVLFAARVAHELQISVLDVDYRKAPEHPFPAAIHDVEDALHWVGSEANMKRFDTSRVAVSGFSAGGTLALVAASTLRERLQQAGVNISAAVAMYPATDLVTPAGDKKPPKDGIDPMGPGLLKLFLDCYIPDESVRADPRASLARADPQSYPQTVAILTCEGDRLAPEALALAEKLEKDRRRTVIREMVLGVPQ